MDNCKTGKSGENSSVEFLIRKKHTIIERNFRNYIGEIDIISCLENTLYFIEVKNWYSDKVVHPLEIFTNKKIKKMRTLASKFIADNLKYKDYYVSFGMIRLKGDEITFYENLF